jgi:NADH:ubiquinone oxidoreductase subunit 6 (subunit J)
MLVSHFLDLVPIWLMLIGTILILVLFIEYGFRLGKKAQSTAKKAQTSQVRAIMGAGLGLLAFMLAFTFSTAQSHFEARVQNLVEEARIARNAFIQANLLEEPRRTESKTLLKDYVGLRRDSTEISNVPVEEQLAGLLERAEKIQHRLMLLAVETDKTGEHDNSSSLESPFAHSVLMLIDIHFTRLHSAVMNRIPLTIWMTLYLMAALSMTIMGYQAGLTGRRSPVATITLTLAFSAVIILITDLDRPVMSFFDINDQLLVDLYEYMEEDMRLEHYAGD